MRAHQSTLPSGHPRQKVANIAVLWVGLMEDHEGRRFVVDGGSGGGGGTCESRMWFEREEKKIE